MGKETSGTNPGIPHVTIHVVRGKASTTSREMKGRSLLVGSGPQCDIQMRSPDVAPKHALITRGTEGVVIRQLDTDRPLLVNGSQVTESLIGHGDSIKVGPFELSVSIEGSAPPAALEVGNNLSALTPSSRGNGSFFASESTVPVPKTGLASVLRNLARPSSASSFAANVGAIPPIAPESINDLQNASSETEKNESLSRRQVYSELTKIESERAQLNQEKHRFGAQRHMVDRQLRDLANKDAEIARLGRETEDRHRKVAEAEQFIESSRLKLAEEAIQLDRKLERFETRKMKLLRVRRRLLGQYKDRRSNVSQQLMDLEQRSRALQQDRTQLEADIAHNKRVADELGKRQADVKRLEAEIQRRNEVIERREKELRERQDRFESELANIQSREKAIDTLRVDLDRRKMILAEEEATLRESRKSAEEQLERAKLRSSEIQQRHEESEARRLTIERQEQYLRDQAQALEKQRVQIVDLDKQVAAREAQIQQKEAEILAVIQQFETRENDLRIRELSLSEQIDSLSHKENRLKEWESQTTLDQQALERRFRELEEQTRAMLEHLDRERSDVESRRREIDQMHREGSRIRESIDDQEGDWAVRMSELRELAAEMAHRESIVHARQSQLDSIEKIQSAERETLLARERSLLSGAESLQAERQKFEQQSSEVKSRIAMIEAEVERLNSLSFTLEHRQKTLLEQESHWSEEVKSRRLEFEQLSHQLERRQTLLDRQATVQKRRVQKLRDLTGRLFGRAPQARQKAELIQGMQEAAESRLGDTQASEKELINRLREEVEYIQQHEEQSVQSSSQIKADTEQLAKVQGIASEQVRSALRDLLTSSEQDSTDASNAGTAIDAAETSLRTWSGYLEQAVQHVEDRTREIEAQQKSLARLEQDVREKTDAMALTAQQSTAPPKPKPRRPASWQELVEPALIMADDELESGIARAGLLDESRVHWFKQTAQTKKARLAHELVRTGALTAHQVVSISQGNERSLRLGPALILDTLHSGSVATTYLVRLPGTDRPVAARALKPQWSRDPGQRRQYEIVLQSLRQFTHPNIVASRGSMSVDDQFVVLTDFVESIALSELVAYSVPSAVLINICFQALGAVSAAERAGFTHHAIRPSRLLLGRSGDLHLLGYGEPEWLRKIHRCEKGRSYQNTMAPELIASGPTADARADVYSIGKIATDIAIQESGAQSLQDAVIQETYPAEFLKLLIAMTAPSSSDRPKPTEALREIDPVVDPYAATTWPDLTILFQQLDELSVRRSAA